jgi:SHS family lactate transporter-like MFS transporter
MVIVDELKALTKEQRSAFTASLLGWTLDAFDFFILTFVVKEAASEFHMKASDILGAVTITLMLRAPGALFFGWLADKFGRRPVLMADVLLYSGIELATAFSPNFTVFIILRALFGFAMGGEWGIGASLAFESLPRKNRGLMSGILQEGYAMGFLLAAVVNYFAPAIGWRGMFMVGVLPALLVLYIRIHVKESPAWEATKARAVAHGETSVGVFRALFRRWGLLAFAVLMMTAFNFFSHGTQDVYPTFLKVQHKFNDATASSLTIVMNIGAIVGGVMFGYLSDRIGRRKAIALAAVLCLPVLPLWAFSATPLLLGLGGFLMQICVQGAWGVVPIHLNELSPDEARGTFPGFAYQLGNLIAAGNAYIQGRIAEAHGNNYGLALALVAGIVAVILAVVTFFGPEHKDVRFGEGEAELKSGG